ncbi:MAG: substrate-binding domain-containing protein [Acidobacteriaceae bacterium]
MKAFRKEAQGSGIPVLDWSCGPTGYESGTAAAALLSQGIDGAFCVTDLLALGFLDAARYRHGLAVPDALSIVGFDDIPQADWLGYRLTTVRQPLEAMAEAVVRLLDRPHPSRDAPEIERLVLLVTLIERGTVRARPIQDSRQDNRR